MLKCGPRLGKKKKLGGKFSSGKIIEQGDYHSEKGAYMNREEVKPGERKLRRGEKTLNVKRTAKKKITHRSKKKNRE